MSDLDKINAVFEFPFFETLAHRRVRRFGLGYDYVKADFRYTSQKAPVPLDDVETALLAWAANGISGLAMGEGQVVTGVHSTWNGRVHAAACNDQHSLLIIVNDEGVFAYEPPAATRLLEIASPDDRIKILEAARQGMHKLSDKRPDFTNAGWISANQWMANKPGSTIFFPVVDLSAEHINHVLAGFEREKLKVLDERTRGWAGVRKWVDNGTLNGATVTMRYVDQNTLNAQLAGGFFMAQNLNLACEALGLGCAVTGCAAPVVLGGTPFTEGLGFRFQSDKDGELNPVGLDGHLEAFCPPYVKNMNEAVDRFLDIRYGENGILCPDYDGPTPVRDWQKIADTAAPISPQTVAAAKDFCNFVYDNYGRFPALFDTMQLPVMITVHHVDVDFYDAFYPPEAVSPAIRRHLSDWHGL